MTTSAAKRRSDKKAGGSIKDSPMDLGADKLSRTPERGSEKHRSESTTAIPLDAREKEKADSNSLDHLKGVLVAMDKKLLAMSSRTAEMENTQARLEAAEQARADLQLSLEESAEKMKALSEKTKNMEQIVIGENKELNTQNLITGNKLHEAEQENLTLRSQLEAQRSEKKALDATLSQLRAQAQDVEATERALEEMRKHNEALETSYRQALDRGEQEAKDYRSNIETTLKEHRAMTDQMQQLNKELAKLQIEIRASNAEKETLKNQNKSLADHVEVLNATIREGETYRSLARERENVARSLQQTVDTLRAELAEYKERSLRDYKSLAEKYDAKCKELQAKEAEKAELDGLFKELTEESMEHQRKAVAYEQLICASEDMHSRLDACEQTLMLLRGEKAKVEQELLVSAAQLERVENKSHEFERRLASKTQELQAKDEQIDVLKTVIHDLKMKIHVYVPAKGDVIDAALAEYLNALPDTEGIGLMFTRESEGIYRFGSKRVFVKLEQDKLMVRVGGGYLCLDEFLELYGPTEMDKLNKGKPFDSKPTK